jgi:hypothetical protein
LLEISRLGRNCATVLSMANFREIFPSLDGSEDTDAAAAWLEELDRRAREIISGTAKLEDWTKVR